MATTKTIKSTKSTKSTKKTTSTSNKTSTKIQITTKLHPETPRSTTKVQINKDAKILCICESPNKKSTLEKIFKDLGYKNLKVEASVGHITEIKNNSHTKWNTGIHVDDNFKVDYVVSEDKKKVVADLQAKVKAADIVLLASDPDREGEAIAFHLKKELKIADSKYYRISFNEITKAAVSNAIDHPHKINMDLADAAEARAGADTR